MFSLIWRFFPGPVWVRVLVLLALAVALVYVLITYVYPYAATFFVSEETTVET